MKRRSSLILLFLTLLMSLVLSGCPSSSKFPDVNSRSIARQATLSMSFGIDVVTDVCVGVMRGIAEDNVPAARVFGKRCYNILKPAAATVSAAAAVVDQWDSDASAFQKVACTAKYFAQKFWPEAKALIAEFTAPPKEVDDVVSFLGALADAASSQCAWEAAK